MDSQHFPQFLIWNSIISVSSHDYTKVRLLLKSVVNFQLMFIYSVLIAEISGL